MLLYHFPCGVASGIIKSKGWLPLRTDSPDTGEVALAPEAKGGEHPFFDIQRTITVLPLYIALMRFLIKLNSIICPMYPMPAIML